MSSYSGFTSRGGRPARDAASWGEIAAHARAVRAAYLRDRLRGALNAITGRRRAG
ncbi:MAG: hypothetical protein ACE5H8_08660 [Alphaproteobacteria bacterium]